MADDVKTIQGMVERFIGAFCVVDPEPMKEFWPKDYSDIVYQSEENQHALGTHEEISSYWDNVPNSLEGIPKVEDADLRIHVHSQDIATVYVYAMATAKFPGSEELYKAPFRATIVLKRLNGEWKFVHYHESRVLDLDRVTEALNAGEAEVLAYGRAHA